MASFTVQEHRPLKKLRLCNVGPDVYPQDPKQKEVRAINLLNARVKTENGRKCKRTSAAAEFLHI